MTDTTENKKQNIIERPPVIVIMGHIDHGKSTLLDYIRKTNTTLKEAGGITQRIAAYEATHTATDGKQKRITFIDTPGHEAFKSMRSCGAQVADIAVLVVSAEEGVKPQTMDAYRAIQESKTPMIVALNKIDRPGANIEKAKNSLLEHEIYVEGYGGSVPCVPISAKTGEGVSDLLDMMILLSDVEELTGDTSDQGSGVIIESHLDKSKGVTATVIIKNGTFTAGLYVATEHAIAPLRIMNDFTGAPIKTAILGAPITIIGWDELPRPGSEVKVFQNKKEALAWREEAHNLSSEIANEEKLRLSKMGIIATGKTAEHVSIPIIIKATSAGSVEAILHELKKIETEKVSFKIISATSGNINENDIKMAIGSDTIVIGFDIKIDTQAEVLREREGTEVKLFDIIYKMSEYLSEVVKERTPKFLVAEETGRARILKIFNSTKKTFILGGKVDSGKLLVGGKIKLLRREGEIGEGMIKELQQQKEKTREVLEGFEFGAAVECSIEPAPGDVLQAFTMIEK